MPRARPGPRRMVEITSMQGRRLPPKYLNLFLVLSIGLHVVLPIRRILHAPYTYLGLAFIFCGVALNLWSVSCLKRQRTTNDFFEAPSQLVMDGPFRMSRNPIYLSGVATSLGVAILLGSLIAFVFPIALWVILNGLYIPIEEELLEKTFGEEYLGYKQRVRRWF